MEYRILAELLCSCAMLMAVEASPRLQATFQRGHRGFSGWVKWYVDALVRSFGVLRVQLDQRQRDVYRRQIMDRLDRQIRAYHVPRLQENSLIAARIKQIGKYLFIVVILGCLAGLLAGFPGLDRASWWNRAANWISTAAAFYDLGGAPAVFAYQTEFSKLAQISGIFEQQLRALLSKTNASSSSGENLRNLTTEAAELLMQEDEDWYPFYPLRELEKPI